jgi:hypothetical protein
MSFDLKKKKIGSQEGGYRPEWREMKERIWRERETHFSCCYEFLCNQIKKHHTFIIFSLVNKKLKSQHEFFFFLKSNVAQLRQHPLQFGNIFLESIRGPHHFSTRTDTYSKNFLALLDTCLPYGFNCISLVQSLKGNKCRLKRCHPNESTQHA